MLAILVCAQPASAQYLTRYTTLTNGAVTFTGNSLGLDGAPGQNGQGTRGGIATFITTDTTLRDATPAPSSAPLFPFGTTSDWQQNRSTAVLRMPAGARVLRAELIWGGSFADESVEGYVAAFRNNAVSFTTPAGTFSVSPDPASARNFGTLDGTRCASARECYYVRTADVTRSSPRRGLARTRPAESRPRRAPATRTVLRQAGHSRSSTKISRSRSAISRSSSASRKARRAVPPRRSADSARRRQGRSPAGSR